MTQSLNPAPPPPPLEADVLERIRVLQDTIERLEREMATREAAELALRQSQKLEAVAQLTGGIAHDFNNLLTGVIGSLDLIRRRLLQDRPEELPRLVDTAMTSAKRAAALTNRLLMFARRRPLEPRTLDLNQVIAALEDQIRRTLSGRVELEVALPAPAASIVCDPEPLEAAILNLVANARDAMPSGGRLAVEAGEMTLNASQATRWGVQPGPYVVVSVTDTGVGMTPEVVARAVEPFFSTRPLGVGAGLGLPMAYSFARQSGGGLRIDSEPGRGTRVRLCLPRAPEAEARSDDRDTTAAVAPSGEDPVILVVEDEQAVRALVLEVLHEHGYRGVAAVDGLSALEILYGDAPVDLVLCDVGLPGLDGLQVVEAARRHRPGLRAMFMTAYADGLPDPAVRPDGLIRKPFTIDRLLEAVREGLRSPAGGTPRPAPPSQGGPGEGRRRAGARSGRTPPPGGRS